MQFPSKFPPVAFGLREDPRITALFESCGTCRVEAAFAALPASNVPHRLTTVDELAMRERLNQRDHRQGATVIRVCHEANGSHGHRAHAVRFLMSDGTEQYFAPHTN